MFDFEKEFEERLSKGLKIIEDYFEEHWGSDIHLKYAKRIFDIWAVGEAKRYECINTKSTYFKQMSKNEKAKALEFNDLLEQEFEDYAKELVKEYQKKYPIEESKKSARKSMKESKNDIDFNNLNGFVNFKEYGDNSRGGGAFSEIKKLFEKDSSFQYIVSLIKDLESDFELTKFTFSSNGEINISFKEVGGNFEFFVKYEIVRSGIGLTNLRYF